VGVLNVILAMVLGYLAGWAVTSLAVFDIGYRVRDESGPASPRVFGAMTIAAGALWPLLVLGAVELGSVMTYAKLTSRTTEATFVAHL
jgi:hypothetical protein